MPEEPPTPPPETPPPHRPGQHVGTAFSGETTGSGTNFRTGDETVLMGSGASASAQVIGDFEVLSKLGQGGMGAVYRARQRSLDRQVALKILPTTLEADADFVSRFQREARVAASLNHANLVKVYSSGQADGCHFIAMELIEGETLGQWLKRGPLPPSEALRICADVARALEHGWNRAQLIHRDIKPGNIFLSVHGDVKVGDLGLAKSIGADTTGLTHTGTAMGTPHYISPEQARGDKDLDFRADIYSLGCTLFQMLTGRTPYEGRDPMNVMYQHINSPPPAILKVLPGCPIPLARLVGKMLKKIKRERQTSYAELLAEIERVSALFAPTESVLESTLPPDPDSTLLATPGHTPRSATPVTAPLAPTTSSVTATKSKAPLYGGVAAAVVVIGIVAFLAWPKEEKLTKAEIMAKQREAEQAAAKEKAGGTGSSASPTSAGDPGRAGTRPSGVLPAAIKLYDTAEKVRNGGRGAWEKEALRLDRRGAGIETPVARDIIFRSTVLMNPDAVSPELHVRHSHDTFYRIVVDAGKREIYLSAVVGNVHQPLGKWNLPRNFAPDEWMKVELRAVGDELAVSADGQTLGTVRDGRVSQVGGVMVYALANGYFRDIEYIPLDGVAATAAATSTSRTWQPLVTDEVWRKEVPGDREYRDGQMHLRRGALSSLAPAPDLAVRTRVVIREGSVQPGLFARWSEPQGSYRFGLSNDGQHLFLGWMPPGHGPPSVLGRHHLPRRVAPGDTLLLELRVQGDRLTALYNGAVVIEARDDRLTAPGRVGVWAADGWFESAEVQTFAPATAELWQDVLRDPAKLVLTGGAERTPEGLLLTGPGPHVLNSGPTRDGAIRMRTKFGGLNPQLWARRSAAGSIYELALKDAGTVLVARYQGSPQEGGPETKFTLKEFPLPQPLPVGQDYELELRVIGVKLTAKFNGQILGSVEDSRLKEGPFGVGSFEKGAAPTLIESLEVLDLDKPVTASTLATSAVWTDGLAEWWAGPNAGQLLAKDGAGAKVLDRTGIYLANRAPMGDVAVRVTIRGLTDYCAIFLRQQRREDGVTRQYQAALQRDGSTKLRLVLEKTGELAGSPPIAGFDPAKSHTLELSAHGDQLRIMLDGAEVAAAQNRTIADGILAIVADPGAIIEKLEYRRLGGASASPGASSAPAAPMVGAPALEPGAMRLWDSPDKLPTGRPGIQWKDDALYISSTTLVVEVGKTPLRQRDSILRFALRTNTAAQGASIVVRDAGTPKTPRLYSLRLSPKDKLIEFWSGNGEPEQRKLQTWPFPRAYGDDEWMRVEFRTVGDLFTVTVDGAVVGTVRDATVTGPGLMHFGSKLACYFRNIEYVPLDDAPATSTANILTFDGHRYQLLAEPLTWSAAKARAEAMGGHLATINSPRESSFVRDQIVPKLSALTDKPSSRRLLLGGSRESAGAAWQWITGEPFDPKLWVGEPTVNPPAGTQYLVWDFGGKRWDTVSDNWAPFPLIEWDSADVSPAAGSASSTSAATATKDAPFVNGLGMKFVPVPITGGPTGGQRVLFSIWETRVQDYEVFATETKRAWPKAGFEQGTTHAVVNVRWEDAAAFCAWLTERERKAGRLGANERYRLPSDHEWSCAVGLGEREDAAMPLKEKEGRSLDIFPWGDAWPPPEKSGNYWSEELRPLLVAGKYTFLNGELAGYRDGFAETAPVGSYAANAFGLHDLGGNAWEWVEDWADAKTESRVLRGGAWVDHSRGNHYAAKRHSSGNSAPYFGFRVVLAPVP